MQALKKTGRRSPGMINLLALAALLFFNFNNAPPQKNKTGTLKITFKNTVNGIPLVLDSNEYSNIFGETFRVSKFKYYISNISLENKLLQQKEEESYHLADARDTASLSFNYPVATGEYNDIVFLLGVDSLRNCSGAQTGALDPMNDMFWTWNSGYVMAKLEGPSPLSPALRRMEYHIGGYRANNNVVQKINLHTAAPIRITAGSTTQVIIETDISKWWQGKERVTIAENPVCTTPGELAKRIAVNYSNMFSIQSISNY